MSYLLRSFLTYLLLINDPGTITDTPWKSLAIVTTGVDMADS